MKEYKIFIAGLGNVGSQVVKSIEENYQFIKKKSGIKLTLKGLQLLPLFYYKLYEVLTNANYSK